MRVGEEGDGVEVVIEEVGKVECSKSEGGEVKMEGLKKGVDMLRNGVI